MPDAVVRHRVGAVTSPATLGRRLVSAHHNLLRFALKCLPPRAAARVVAGELLRLPRHPALVAPALGRIVAELPEEPLVIDKLINEIAPKNWDRNSGYTRIVKIGNRAGDGRALHSHLDHRTGAAERPGSLS